MKTIVKMKFGSKLYGTDTPESDTDYKGIFIPSQKDCYLNRIPKSINHTTGSNDSKNTKNDIDEEYYSLQYFMKLAAKGEMIVIDMLHAPENMLIESTGIWRALQANRSIFYTKNLGGYLGYIKKQTAKYGIKGSRLAAMKNVIDYLEYDGVLENRLDTVWDTLPINNYCKMIKVDDKIFYEVCGKKFGPTIRIHYMKENIQTMYNSYGSRAKLAEKNEGIDWKAISHAYRASVQLIEIYETGDLKYPLAEADFIRKLKQGKLHYKNDNIQQLLEDKLELVEQLIKNSDLPDKFNQKWAETFIIQQYIGNTYDF